MNRALAFRVLTAGIVAFCLTIALLEHDIALLWVHAIAVTGGVVMGTVVVAWLQRRGLL